MARFKIISKDGKSIRYEGKPRYVGTYLKPSFLEFNEIASPTPIAWEVGDYVDYPRTGMRYYLYSIPQASKNATKNSHGKAFTYSGVQLHAATKELEIAPFRDIVANDNNIHFSTSPDVTTFEDIYGIALRIQECMNDLYPDRWEIRVADFDDADIIEKVTTKKDFALSGGTCLDALSKIYELWQDVGWIHTYDKDLGKEVITIGYANALRGDNVSEKFLYGKGNGLTAIKKNQINKEEFATRLYVYGSERNLPPRYYGQADFPNAESADIRNLMLPLDAWGLTNGSPDPRKAYLQNDEAVAKYGVIPKTHYFDSDDAGADIYPTIKRLTIGEIRDVIASDNPYYPSSLYSDTERADIILGASNPSDDGVSNREGKRYEDTKAISPQISSPTIVIPEGSTKEISRKDVLFNVLFEHEGMGEVSVSPNMNILVQGIGIDGIIAEFELSDDITKQQKLLEARKVEAIQISESTWSVSMPKMSLKYNQREYESFRAYMVMRLIVTPVSSSERTLTIIPPTTPLQVNFSRILPNTFNIKLKQIGFNIEERASQGKGKTISMKSGMCEGRGFVISSCVYDDSDDSWNLICRRQKDETLGVLFPNVDYPVQSGDEFILLDIAMPDSYIHIAANRLLEEGEKLLSKASKAIYNYEPAIDARVMAESGRKIREGLFMEITDEDIVDNTTEYILIDTLNINEDESAIPAYRITLRERRKVTYKGTPSATSPSSTSSVEEESEDDNSKLLQRLSELEFLKDMFYWHDEAKTIIATNHSLIVKDEMASAGTGADNDGSESVSVINSWNDYNPNITQALGAILGVELHERLTAVEGGISEYATISFVEKAISDLIGGADGAYDTLLKIQQILQGNEASIGTILEEIGKKASKEDLAALELRVKAIEDAESEDMFAWADEEHTTIETEKNLVVKGDFSDAGVAGEVNIGITSIVVDGVSYPDSDRDGVIDLTGAFENINVNLDNYYTKTEVYNKQETYSKDEVNELVKGGESDMFAWADEAKTTIKTEKNLIVEGELSDSGVAGNVTVGISTIRIDSKDYTDTDRDGIIDLTDALKAFDFNLEDYATKAEVSVINTKVNSLVDWKEDFLKYIYVGDDHLVHVTTDIIIGGDIATAADGEGGGSYASIGIIVGNSLAEYPNTAGIVTLSKELITSGIGLGELAFKDSLVASDIPDLSGKYLPFSGGTIKGSTTIPLVLNTSSSEGSFLQIQLQGANRADFGYNANVGAYFSNNAVGYRIGISAGGTPYYYNGVNKTLIHSGNISDQSVAYATNAGMATKLQTARKIWGQSFDGTTDITGWQYLPNMGVTAFYDSAGNAINVLHFSDANNLHLGYGNRTKAYNTFISGNDIYLYYGSGTLGFILNSSGNVGIGSTSPAYKLDVHGITRSTGEFISTNSKGVGFRTVNGGYGVFFQNGGSNCYLLTTAQNDAYGSYNSLRPFAFNLSTGKVTLGEETTVSKLLTASGGATIPAGKTLLLGSKSLGATLQYITDVGVKIDGNLVVTGDLSDAGVADNSGSVGGYFDIAIYPQYAYGDIYLAEIVLNGSDAYCLYMPSVTEYIGYTPFNEAEFTRDNIKSRLGISDWALAASKPSYTTNDVSEGDNLYFTNARAKSAIFTGSSSQFLKADGTLDSTTYLGLNASGNLSISGVVFTNGIEFAQDVYISYLNNRIEINNRYAGIYLNAGNKITLDGVGVDIFSTADDMLIYSEGVMEIGCDSDMEVYAYGELSMHSEGKASITSDMAITITGANISIGTEDRSASFLLQDGFMEVYCDLAIQGSLHLQHTGNYIGTGTNQSMLFHSENNAIIFEVGEDQKVSITEDGLYVTSINDYKFDVTTAVTSESLSLVTSGAVYSAFSLFPSNAAVKNDRYLAFRKTDDYERRIFVSSSNEFYVGYGNSSSSSLVTRVFGSPILFHVGNAYADTNIAMRIAPDGDVEINNNLIVKGDQATGSDIRFKNVIEDNVLDVKRIAEAPLFTFKWNDRNDDSIHLGSSAQYWENVCPWLVSGEDFKTLNYATLGVAMGISLAKKTVNHEERIKELERKVESLETENRRLRYGN